MVIVFHLITEDKMFSEKFRCYFHQGLYNLGGSGVFLVLKRLNALE